MALSATVNRGKCCGYGVCAEVCPEVFKVDHQGFAVVAGDGTVAPEHEAKAREAAAACPELAITVAEG